jgi:cyclopropane fatty-acyl-phospholipid synthase-like methyltransferase
MPTAFVSDSTRFRSGSNARCEISARPFTIPPVDKLAYAEGAFDRSRVPPDAMNQLYESGRSTAAAMLREVGPTFRGRSVAIEIGCGVGHVLLGHAGSFEQVRGVDVSPRNLALLDARASQMGITNVEGFLPDQPWDWPTATADYVYSAGLFQYMEDRVAIATWIQRISGVMRRNGIAHLQFDTRPRTLPYRASRYLPDPVLPRSDRRGVRSIRRKPTWVWDRLRGADLEVFGESDYGTAGHWYLARRR